MTTDELRLWMDDRLNRLEVNIRFRCDLEHECIAKLEKDVKSHDRWISSLKGMWIGIGLLSATIWHILRK